MRRSRADLGARDRAAATARADAGPGAGCLRPWNELGTERRARTGDRRRCRGGEGGSARRFSVRTSTDAQARRRFTRGRSLVRSQSRPPSRPTRGETWRRQRPLWFSFSERVERAVGEEGFFVVGVDALICADESWTPRFVALDGDGDEVARAEITLIDVRHDPKMPTAQLCSGAVGPHGPNDD